jgi:hypothetical protein
VIGGVAAKVRCRTCHSDHDFRHEQPPPPKVDSRKAALFNEVLKTVDPEAAAAAILEAEAPEAEPEEVPEAAVEAAAGAEPVIAKPADAKPAAKGKSKAKK